MISDKTGESDTTLYVGEEMKTITKDERLKEQYNVEQTEVGGRAAVNLTAKSGEHSATVVADSSGVLPESIVYTEEGSRVKITFTSITGHKDSLPRFDRAKYAGYEVIDMR